MDLTSLRLNVNVIIYLQSITRKDLPRFNLLKERKITKGEDDRV